MNNQKILLIMILAVVVVSIVIFVGRSTGQAFSFGGSDYQGSGYSGSTRTSCQWVNGQLQCGGSLTLPTETIATTCKIMDIRELAHLRGLTGQTACSNEGLVCKNVLKYYRDSWLDNTAKVQASDTEFSWHSRCNEDLDVQNVPANLPEYSPIDYAEPYAGPHQIYEENIAVLCCSN